MAVLLRPRAGCLKLGVGLQRPGGRAAEAGWGRGYGARGGAGAGPSASRFERRAAGRQAPAAAESVYSVHSFLAQQVAGPTGPGLRATGPEMALELR